LRCKETTKKYIVTIDEDQCKGCLLCVHICNTRGGKVLKESEKKTALGGTKPELDGDCIGCRWCERYCPDFAINVEETDDA
jgi:2-oxoglutarate ferredoxin oxidoreductase subunit delta